MRSAVASCLMPQDNPANIMDMSELFVNHDGLIYHALSFYLPIYLTILLYDTMPIAPSTRIRRRCISISVVPPIPSHRPRLSPSLTVYWSMVPFRLYSRPHVDLGHRSPSTSDSTTTTSWNNGHRNRWSSPLTERDPERESNQSSPDDQEELFLLLREQSPFLPMMQGDKEDDRGYREECEHSLRNLERRRGVYVRSKVIRHQECPERDQRSTGKIVCEERHEKAAGMLVGRTHGMCLKAPLCSHFPASQRISTFLTSWPRGHHADTGRERTLIILGS